MSNSTPIKIWSGIRLGGSVLLLIATTFASGQKVDVQHLVPFIFHFDAIYGPHAVGFQVVRQYDTSRHFSLAGSGGMNATIDRPLQTLIWYPARKAAETPMRLGNFEKLVQTETNFTHPTTSGSPQKFVDSYMAGTETVPTVSLRNAPSAAGKYPLVIYAPSLNAPATENIELCEYLASRGFVVIASASIGSDSRRMTVDQAGAQAEAADISFLIHFAGSRKDVDTKRIAVVGYSWGATGALLAAENNRTIKAFVSMDGSFRYALPPDFPKTHLMIPLLLFTRGETPLLPQTTGDESIKAAGGRLLQQFQGPLYQVRLLAVSHIQFSSLYQRSERFKREGMQFTPADYTLRDGVPSYAWMARYTAEFLDAFLKNDQQAKAFLSRQPEQNGVPPRLIQVKSGRPE